MSPANQKMSPANQKKSPAKSGDVPCKLEDSPANKEIVPSKFTGCPLQNKGTSPANQMSPDSPKNNIRLLALRSH